MVWFLNRRPAVIWFELSITFSPEEHFLPLNPRHPLFAELRGSTRQFFLMRPDGSVGLCDFGWPLGADRVDFLGKGLQFFAGKLQGGDADRLRKGGDLDRCGEYAGG
jgi:hypothetical protein